MLSRPFGRIEIPLRALRRDHQVEHLLAENARLKAALIVRERTINVHEKTIKRLRAEIENGNRGENR